MTIRRAVCSSSAWLGELGYDIQLLDTDDNYARRAVAREWLRGRDWNPDMVFPDNPETLTKSEWSEPDIKAREIALREWYTLMLEKYGEDLPEAVRVDPLTSDEDTLTEMAAHDHLSRRMCRCPRWARNG